MEKQVTLELTVSETNLILGALGKLPLETTLPLFIKIKESAEKQVKESETTA